MVSNKILGRRGYIAITTASKNGENNVASKAATSAVDGS